MNTQVSSFEHSLLAELRSIRSRLADANIPSMRLDIEVSGGTLHGNLKVTFKLNLDSYSGPAEASGGSLDAVVEEFLRRRGWNQRHAALLLGIIEPEATERGAKAAPEELNDEIIF